jgi:hypothetical protein
MSEFGELSKVDAVNMVMALCRYYVDLNKKFWDDHSSDFVLRDFDDLEFEFFGSIPEVIREWLKGEAWFMSEHCERYGAYKLYLEGRSSNTSRLTDGNSNEMQAESVGGESEGRSLEDGEISCRKFEGVKQKYLCEDWTVSGGYKCPMRGELGCLPRNSIYLI